MIENEIDVLVQSLPALLGSSPQHIQSGEYHRRLTIERLLDAAPAARESIIALAEIPIQAETWRTVGGAKRPQTIIRSLMKNGRLDGPTAKVHVERILAALDRASN